jgi:hypothetical protein
LAGTDIHRTIALAKEVNCGSGKQGGGLSCGMEGRHARPSMLRTSGSARADLKR